MLHYLYIKRRELYQKSISPLSRAEVPQLILRANQTHRRLLMQPLLFFVVGFLQCKQTNQSQACCPPPKRNSSGERNRLFLPTYRPPPTNSKRRLTVGWQVCPNRKRPYNSYGGARALTRFLSSPFFCTARQSNSLSCRTPPVLRAAAETTLRPFSAALSRSSFWTACSKSAAGDIRLSISC